MDFTAPVNAPPPQVIYLDWTDYCNAKCFFCPREQYEQEIGGKGGFIPFERLKTFENALRAVKFFGISSGIGEPLLHPELHKILEWLYEINPKIRLRTVTNGTSLTAAKAAWFAGHLDWLSISLNASNAEAHLRDMFPHLRKTREEAAKRWNLHIRRISEFIAALPAVDRPRIRLQAVAHRYNLDDLVEFVRLAATMGVSHVAISNIAVHEHTVDYSLYWVKDRFNDVVDEAATVAAELGVRLDTARFFTSLKRDLDLDRVCRDPVDVAYVNRTRGAAPCCHWTEPTLAIDDAEDGFDRYWNSDVLTRLRRKRDFVSCRVCGMARVFDETSFHFSPNMKQGLLRAGQISDIDAENDYPDAELVRSCVDIGIDLPTVRRTLLRVGLATDLARPIEKDSAAALPALDQACWEAFQRTDAPLSASVDIALSGPFSGIGWGVAGYDPDSRKSWRSLGHGGAASVFACVAPGSDYEVRFIFHDGRASALSSLEITAYGHPLETRVLTDSGGRVFLAADIAASTLTQNGGRLWLTVGYASDKRGELAEKPVSFSRLEITKVESGILNVRSRRMKTVIGQLRARKRLAQMKTVRLWSQAKLYAAVIKADPTGSIPRIKRRIARALGFSSEMTRRRRP